MKKTTMKNATRKMKKHNCHAMVFAAIIIAMFFVFVHVETATYVEITTRRNQNAKDLEWRANDMEVIERESEQCVIDLEELGNRSPLGKVLAKNDETKSGHLINYLIVYGSRWGLMYCIFYIIRDVVRMVRFLSCKEERYYQNSPNHLKTLNNQ